MHHVALYNSPRKPDEPKKIEDCWGVEHYFEVEDGVEFPSDSGVGAKCKYPWNDMNVGSSFFVTFGKLSTMRAACRYHNKKGKKMFKCRETPTGVRVWRVL